MNRRSPPFPLFRSGLPARGVAGDGARWTRTGRALLFAVALAALVAAPLAGADSRAREYALKAAFLYNFAKFVEWPAVRFADGRAPFVIGVLGTDPFGAELQSVVQGRKINGHDLVVVRYPNAKSAEAAAVLFVNTGEGLSASERESALSHFGVLTVGETELFSRSGGIITFRVRGDKLGFDINVSAAERAGLKISSQLQNLATAIVRQP